MRDEAEKKGEGEGTVIENTFIYLFGFAGAGKLTIAKEIQKHVPCILVDTKAQGGLSDR
jgi:adenylylsulfate kinase-like enzyme